jgi:hypothetical protein
MQPHRSSGEGIDAALLAVDHADGIRAPQALDPERLKRLHGGAAGGHDVLDQADRLARLEPAFDPVARPVPLALAPDDQERPSGGERRGRGERDRSELGSCQTVGLGLDLVDGLGDQPPERAEDLGSRLKAVLVEVVRGPATGAQDEVAFQVGGLADRVDQLVAIQRAAWRTSRASGSRRSASADPSTSETIEPSSKYRSARSRRRAARRRSMATVTSEMAASRKPVRSL